MVIEPPHKKCYLCTDFLRHTFQSILKTRYNIVITFRDYKDYKKAIYVVKIKEYNQQIMVKSSSFSKY
jgi:hypothetical protein